MIYPTKKYRSEFKATPKIPKNLADCKPFFQRKYGLCYFIASREKQIQMEENYKKQMESVFDILQKATSEVQELQKAKKIQDGQRLAEWIESSIANLPVEMQEKAKATAKAARVEGMPERCLISTDTAEKMPYIKSLPCTVLEDGNLPTNTILFLWDSNIPDFSGECINCKFWNQTADEIGFCMKAKGFGIRSMRLIESILQSKELSDNDIEEIKNEVLGGLRTDHDFGCIHFEA